MKKISILLLLFFLPWLIYSQEAVPNQTEVEKFESELEELVEEIFSSSSDTGENLEQARFLNQKINALHLDDEGLLDKSLGVYSAALNSRLEFLSVVLEDKELSKDINAKMRLVSLGVGAVGYLAFSHYNKLTESEYSEYLAVKTSSEAYALHENVLMSLCIQGGALTLGSLGLLGTVLFSLDGKTKDIEDEIQSVSRELGRTRAEQL